MKTRYKMLTAGGLVLLLIFGAAAQQRKPAANGRAIYLNYCASCHGMDAKGNGVAAAALKHSPGDLTRLRKEGEAFPAEKVRAIITGGAFLPVHGEKEMPVWGGILNEAEIRGLLKYLEAIQQPWTLPPRA